MGEHKPVVEEEAPVQETPAEDAPPEEEKKVTVVASEPIGERKKKKLRLEPTE